MSIVLLSPCFFPSDSCSFFSLQRMLVLLLHPHNQYFIKKLYFVLEYSWLTTFWVSGGQYMDSNICIHESWSQKFPSHTACHIIKQSSLCYTVTHCWLSILNRAVPTTISWSFNSGTLQSLLQSTLTLCGHSRLGWVKYSCSPSPLVSPYPSSPWVSPKCPSADHLEMPFAWNPVQFCLEPSNPPYGSMSFWF